jgi:hypothetical protein
MNEIWNLWKSYDAVFGLISNHFFIFGSVLTFSISLSKSGQSLIAVQSPIFVLTLSWILKKAMSATVSCNRQHRDKERCA